MKLAARALRYRPVHSVSSAPPLRRGSSVHRDAPEPVTSSARVASHTRPAPSSRRSRTRGGGTLGGIFGHVVACIDVAPCVGRPFVTWVVDDGIVGDNNPSPLSLGVHHCAGQSNSRGYHRSCASRLSWSRLTTLGSQPSTSSLAWTGAGIRTVFPLTASACLRRPSALRTMTNHRVPGVILSSGIHLLLLVPGLMASLSTHSVAGRGSPVQVTLVTLTGISTYSRLDAELASTLLHRDQADRPPKGRTSNQATHRALPDLGLGASRRARRNRQRAQQQARCYPHDEPPHDPSLWSADSLALVISARTSRDDQDDAQPEPGARSTSDATSGRQACSVPLRRVRAGEVVKSRLMGDI
jgi:hypothetical protein